MTVAEFVVQQKQKQLLLNNIRLFDKIELDYFG